MKKLPFAAFLLALYTGAFIVVLRLGVFSEERPPLRGVLLFWFVLMAFLAVLVFVLAAAIVHRGRMSRVHWFGVFSLGLLVAGLWGSRFADFGIDVVLTEGQVYESDAHRSVGLHYMGLFSSVPKFRVRMENIALKDAGAGSAGAAVARLQLQEAGGTPPRPLTISRGMPQLRAGMLMNVRNTGYSLRYVLKKSGKVLDSNFISLRIFPPGQEDYFRLLGPQTFYVRYYPGHEEGGKERPLKIKIARNKDIVFSGPVGLGEEVRFEDATISFDETRKWVEVSIRRSWGEMIAWTGAALCCVSGLLLLLRRRGTGGA